jgi:hypothetical protein
MARRLSFGAALLVIGMLVGAIVAPAGAHVTSKFGHLWNKHVAPKLASEGFISNPHVVTEDISVTNGSADYYSSTSATIECPAGEKVLGGGYYAGTVSQAFSVATNAPNAAGTAWELYMHNEAGYTVTVKGYAICA